MSRAGGDSWSRCPEQSWDLSEAERGRFLAGGWMQTALALINDVITKMHLNQARSGRRGRESLAVGGRVQGPGEIRPLITSTMLVSITLTCWWPYFPNPGVPGPWMAPLSTQTHLCPLLSSLDGGTGESLLSTPISFCRCLNLQASGGSVDMCGHVCHGLRKRGRRLASESSPSVGTISDSSPTSQPEGMDGWTDRCRLVKGVGSQPPSGHLLPRICKHLSLG